MVLGDLGRSMDLAKNLYTESTYQDKLNGTKISFVAPSKLKLFSIKGISSVNLWVWQLT